MLNLSINDVTLNEGNSGTTTFTFTVSLSAPAPAGGVTFDIATADNTATAGSDYDAKSLSNQTIAAGFKSYTFDVSVNGDTSIEANEIFDVKISNVVNASLTDGLGQGTLTNDDSLSVAMTSLSTDPTSVSPIPVTVTFSDIATGFVATDITVVNGAVSNFAGSGALYTFNLIPTTSGLVVTADIAAGAALDPQNNGNTAAPQFSRTYDIAPPTVGSTTLALTYTNAGPKSFTINFSKEVNNPVGDTETDDVTNPANYRIINMGGNGSADTGVCSKPLSGDDTQVTVESVMYIPNTAVVTLAAPLPVGKYRLSVCGTTSIVDLAGNHLNNGADSTFDFVVTRVADQDPGNDNDNNNDNNNDNEKDNDGIGGSMMPRTGFAPNVKTTLPAQPAELAYAEMSGLWLEIPSQNVKANIVGVPQSENAWDVKWLGQDAGWLAAPSPPGRATPSSPRIAPIPMACPVPLPTSKI